MPNDPVYTENELLVKLAAGDAHAFQLLFDRYVDTVYAHSLHFTKSVELAKDLTQEIFSKVWINRQKMAHVEKLEAYLFTICKNLIRNELRKKVLDVSNREYLESYFQEDVLSSAHKLEMKELQSNIDEAVNQLPPQLQTAFRLSRYEGLSHEEISRKMNISKFTSKTYIVRAIDALRKYLYEKRGMLNAVFLFFAY